jgi:hypothetical protein
MAAVNACAAHGHASSCTWLYDVGSSEYIDFLEREVLASMVRRGVSACRFLRGDAGTGKTHLLRLLEERCLASGYAVAFINLNQEVSLDQWDLVTKEVLTKVAVRRNGSIIKGMDQIALYYAREQVGPLSARKVRNPCYRNALAHLMRNDRPGARTLLMTFVKGDTVAVKDLRKSGVKEVKKHLTAMNAEATLGSALNLLPLIGSALDPIPGTVLLFDETDNTWVRGKRESEDAANCARRFIDAIKDREVERTFACFAVLNSFLRDCTSYQGLHQRMCTFDELGRAWRYHSIPVTGLGRQQQGSVADRRREFVSALADRGVDIIEYCGGRTDGARGLLQDAGMRSVNRTAGEEYRREVVRAMMNVVSERVRETRGG